MPQGAARCLGCMHHMHHNPLDSQSSFPHKLMTRRSTAGVYTIGKRTGIPVRAFMAADRQNGVKEKPALPGACLKKGNVDMLGDIFI